MDVTFPPAVPIPTPHGVTDAGLDALLLDIEVLSALLFGTPRTEIERSRAA